MPSLRDRERQSIERFLLEHSDKLTGRVLDLGCGQQPYRRIVEQAGGRYVGYDSPHHPGSVVTEHVGTQVDLLARTADTVVMTQVWQYVPIDHLIDTLTDLGDGRGPLKRGGWLLATGPTNWPVVEDEDLHRLTPRGVAEILGHYAGFPVVEVGVRHSVKAEGEQWPVGWWAVARSAQ